MSWEVQTMKLRTSSYKRTWFLKNITRFMPFWVLYTLCLLLGLVLLTGEREPCYFIMNLAACARVMAVVNLFYGLLTAELLFGDIFDSRMCSGLHSLPIRRTEIFRINILSGLLFSLVPTAIMTLFALPLAMGSRVPHAVQVPLYWFAAANLEYLFFFGLAVLSAMLAGNRFSAAVIYGILNFGSLLIYLMMESLYMPLLNGVASQFSTLQSLSPLVRISTDRLITVQRLSQADPGRFQVIGSSWAYLGICAAVGVLLLLLALQFYRRRSLETAGEFVAVKLLRPVFAVLFALCGGIGLNLVGRMFIYDLNPGISVLFAAVGLVTGWFVGLMLLEKTMRVFNRKAFIGGAVILLVMAGSLLLTYLDVFHIASWVPDPQKVESVYVLDGYMYFGEYLDNRENYRFTEPADLEIATEMHTQALLEGLSYTDSCYYHPENPTYEELPGQEPQQRRFTTEVSLEYHMKDGSSRRRSYYIYADGNAGLLFENLMSREAVAVRYPELLDMRKAAAWITVQYDSLPEKYLTEKDTVALLDAIRADCREGHMAQIAEFHPVPVWKGEEGQLDRIDLGLSFDRVNTWDSKALYLEVYSDSSHTLGWLRDRGILQGIIEDIKEQDGK